MHKKPSALLSFCPVVVLILLLAFNVYVFGDNAISGANQIVLLIVAIITALLAYPLGLNWKQLSTAITKSISVAMPAILILLMVGALSGAWLLAGIVPAMIYYGLYVLDPSIFLFASCFISAIVAVATGSSWTTSATVGIALMGIGSALGFNPAMVAGAVLSGAYFGDKMSPLSDTTNLAAAVGEVGLFTHIRYMLLTTIPAISITLIIFILLGLGHSGEQAQVNDIQEALYSSFNINIVLLLAPIAVIVLIIKRMPALPALIAGTFIGVILAILFQQDLISQLATNAGVLKNQGYYIVMTALIGDIHIITNNAIADELLSSKGMSGMLNTIWLIMSAMIFGGTIEAAGFLNKITSVILDKVRNITQLFLATMGTCLFTNFSASDQYLSIIVPGQMYKQAFKKQGLAPQNLSRALEDSGTVTSVLIPWNTCGAFHATVLGVATTSYLPFALFCFLSPLISIIYATTRFKIAYQTETTPEQTPEPANANNA